MKLLISKGASLEETVKKYPKLFSCQSRLVMKCVDENNGKKHMLPTSTPTPPPAHDVVRRDWWKAGRPAGVASKVYENHQKGVECQPSEDEIAEAAFVKPFKGDAWSIFQPWRKKTMDNRKPPVLRVAAPSSCERI